MNINNQVQEAIQALDQATTRDELFIATKVLADTRSLEAATKLIEVLGHNNPATAVVATKGLTQLGPPVIPLLLSSLEASDYTTRAWAITILADLRDTRSLDVLIDAARTDISPSVRRTALRGLATLDFRSTVNGLTDLERCLTTLMEGCNDPEWVVRYAAVFGIERWLASNQLQLDAYTMAVSCLHRCADTREGVRVVRCRAQLALQRLSQG